MNLPEIYQKTLDLLRTDGWCQRVIRDGKKHCLIGALDASTPTVTEYSVAYEELCGLLGVTTISRWNDHPKRTFAEVEDLLLQAIG